MPPFFRAVILDDTTIVFGALCRAWNSAPARYVGRSICLSVSFQDNGIHARKACPATGGESRLPLPTDDELLGAQAGLSLFDQPDLLNKKADLKAGQLVWSSNSVPGCYVSHGLCLCVQDEGRLALLLASSPIEAAHREPWPFPNREQLTGAEALVHYLHSDYLRNQGRPCTTT